MCPSARGAPCRRVAASLRFAPIDGAAVPPPACRAGVAGSRPHCFPASSFRPPGDFVLSCCWSPKGGAGTTVVAAAFALEAACSAASSVLLVDLAGDLPAVLGLPEPVGPGAAEWSRGGCELPLDALVVPVCPGLHLLPRGAGRLAPVDPERFGPFGEVVVDAGVVGEPGSVGHCLAIAAPRSLLVTRPCYLALRRAVLLDLRPTGVVLVVEPGRALGAGDVAAVLGVPVLAEVPVDPSVARSVDAGLLASRVPPPLLRSLRGLR
jgi:hypothetical protein